MLSADGGPPPDEILVAVRDRTNALLGTTITYSEEDWAAPTHLPGWTRSHVAAHLIENARGLVTVCRALRENRPARMYASSDQKARDIERGALADGLTLQINLDTTAGDLHDELTAVADIETSVSLRRGYEVPARLIPLVRLHEVVVHLFDLEPGASDVDILPSSVADALLAMEVDRLRERPDIPAVLVEADEGFRGVVGSGPAVSRASGPAADLLTWLVRGVETPAVMVAPA